MNEHTDTSMNESGSPQGENGIFVNLNQTDSTGIPSLKNAPESAISSSAKDSKMSAQMAVALGVVAVGAGVIYAMRYIGMKAGLDEDVVSIDYTSQTNTGDFNKRFGQVMSQLDESTIAVQLSEYQQFVESPFVRPSAKKVEPEARPIDPGMSEEERMALERERELERQRQQRHDSVVSEAMNLKLQGVVGGSRPAARISGQAVAVGSSVGEFFKVVKITGMSVVIEADGMQFELAMGQETVQLDK